MRRPFWSGAWESTKLSLRCCNPIQNIGSTKTLRTKWKIALFCLLVFFVAIWQDYKKPDHKFFVYSSHFPQQRVKALLRLGNITLRHQNKSNVGCRQSKTCVPHDVIGAPRRFAMHGGVLPKVIFRHISHCQTLREAQKRLLWMVEPLGPALSHVGGCCLLSKKVKQKYEKRLYWAVAACRPTSGLII